MLLTKPLRQRGAQGWAKRELLPRPKENLPRGAHPREPEGRGVCDKGDQGVPAWSRAIPHLCRPGRSKSHFPSFGTISKAL